MLQVTLKDGENKNIVKCCIVVGYRSLLGGRQDMDTMMMALTATAMVASWGLGWSVHELYAHRQFLARIAASRAKRRARAGRPVAMPTARAYSLLQAIVGYQGVGI